MAKKTRQPEGTTRQAMIPRICISENSQQNNSASSALKSRLCYVIQVVIFILAILGLVLFLTIDYMRNTGNYSTI